MDVLITQKKMTDSEAFVKARGGGNLIGKAIRQRQDHDETALFAEL